jgi:outer membrane lipoprotein SlyB
MKKIQSIFALILLSASTASFAGYACPADSTTGGGWSPPECLQMQNPNQAPAPIVPQHTAAYACVPESNTSGGWTPLECRPKQIACADCGTVEAVNKVETDDTNGIGAIAGAVAGGVIGNQVGKKGKGKLLGTVLGAVAGGVGGHYGEKLLRKKTRWDVIVLMQDTTHQTVDFKKDPGYSVGDKVKVNGDTITRQ